MGLKIKRINPPENGKLIGVSDIHGHLHYLKGLLEKVNFSEKDVLVIIGDMIEKGPESLNTVRFVMELMDSGYSVYASMGNVEYHRMARFLDDSPEGNREFLRLLRKMKRVWGGSMFLDMLAEMNMDLEDLTEENAADIKAEMRRRYEKEFSFLRELPAILIMGDFIFVHAGVPTDHLDELKDTEVFSYLKREEFLRENVAFEKYVVVGHWPVCLYRDNEDNMAPIFDWQKHIIALDGGCGLKMGQQLNALVLSGKLAASGKSDGKIEIPFCSRLDECKGEAAFTSWDDFPVISADRPQKGRPGSIVIHYWDSEVRLLRKIGPGVVWLRHISSGIEFPAPESFLYGQEEGTLRCEDYSDALLGIEKGDLLSVVEKTSLGLLVKKDGVMGWYLDYPCSLF